jgi:hypothetical protein
MYYDRDVEIDDNYLKCINCGYMLNPEGSTYSFIIKPPIRRTVNGNCGKIRYMEAYRLYQEGKTVKEISEDMGISIRSIYAYFKFAREKLDSLKISVSV